MPMLGGAATTSIAVSAGRTTVTVAGNWPAAVIVAVPGATPVTVVVLPDVLLIDATAELLVVQVAVSVVCGFAQAGVYVAVMTVVARTSTLAV
jgi:hypothetical protein